MHTLFLGSTERQIQILSKKRNKRSNYLCAAKKNKTSCRERQPLISFVRALKPLAGTADIPGRKIVNKIGDRTHCTIKLVIFERSGNFSDKFFKSRPYPTSKHVGACRRSYRFAKKLRA